MLFRSVSQSRYLGVSDIEGELLFYQFEDGAYNTFSSDLADRVMSSGNTKLRGTISVPVRKLSTVLQDNLPFGQSIDVMSIDVEGFDFNVLLSNDWMQFRPKIILIELQWKSIKEVLQSDIFKYLSNREYVLYSKLINTCVFVLSDFDVGV